MSGGPHGRGAGIDPTQRSANFVPTLRRLVGELGPEKWRVGLGLVFTAAAVVLSVLAPKVLGKGTDLIFEGVIGRVIEQFPSKQAAVEAMKAAGQDEMATMLAAMNVTPGAGIDFAALGRIVLIVIALYLGSALLSWITGMVLRTAVQNTGWRLRDKVHRKIESLPLSYLDRSSRGDLMSRVSNDVDNVTQVLNQTLSQFFQSILTVLGILGMMASMSLGLTGLAMVVLPVGMVVVGVLMSRAQPQFKAQWKSTGDVSGVVEEAMSGHTVAALYGLEKRFTDDFNRSNTELYESSFRAQFVSNLVMPIMNMVSSASYVIVAVGGGLMVAQGAMSLGDVQAFIQYSRQFTQPLGSLASMANMLQSGAASAERIFEFLDAPEMDEDTGTATVAQPVRGRIVFDHVHFSYVPGEPVIKDLSLTVEPGQMVAIIGPTGAGKTTLVNLLMRFYELESGSITIDGVDIRDMSRDELRGHMGMVLQDTWLFDGTIEQNIAFGRDGATHEQVVEAAKATAVDRLVRQLPEGYETMVGDESDALSAGERQLVTIARAFISEPDLLILDEATSSVDTRTEVLVQRAMDRLRHGRTAFVIAHRLSTIRDADLILVMEEGDVVETGRHEDLLALDGAYARLYRASV
ncbi:ABC transporter ATP-binding protein [Schaalia sp. 19OD2882]|uniref:ABC transporter ATP-binding protein n=1 Tax=Schaalia sp. 19OD2882 TaxID=2794089 RepID=UPI001C1EEF1F|nr:ABC transporter ATP-binding protein [Schaalia sp. 19OD2882]QWW19358.1 ABC transporter ATP-binding protein [Schaalia sp. 19OD2882]